MAYFKSQILPSKLTYRTIIQDEQISSDSAYVPVTFSTIQGLEYVTIKLEQDRGGGTVYEGFATIPVSKISGSSAEVANIYLNNNQSIVLYMSYTEASITYSGSYYDMYITILGFPMDIFAPINLVKTPCICANHAQFITLPIDSTQPYIISGKFRLMNGYASDDTLIGSGNETQWTTYIRNSHYLVHRNPNVYIGDTDITSNGFILDKWYEFIDGKNVSEIKGLWAKTQETFVVGDDTPVKLFGDYRNNTQYYSNCAFSRLNISLNDVTVMDLVPINEFYTNYKLIDNTPLSTVYQWNVYPTENRVDYAPQILTHMRIVLKYQDNNGVWHYSTPIFIPRGSVNGGITDIPFTDGGQITNIQLRPDKTQYIFHDITGATKTEFPIYADIRVCRDSEEGGFYDTMSNKYYFSETSTPLVYSEL